MWRPPRAPRRWPKAAAVSRQAFLASGGYAALCIPAILITERVGGPEWFFHLTQFGAVVCCFPSSVVFLWCTRRVPLKGARVLAAVAMLLTGIWLSFIAIVVLTFDLSMM